MPSQISETAAKEYVSAFMCVFLLAISGSSLILKNRSCVGVLSEIMMFSAIDPKEIR